MIKKTLYLGIRSIYRCETHSWSSNCLTWKKQQLYRSVEETGGSDETYRRHWNCRVG